MRAMSKLTTFLKQHTLWAGFAAVLAPLGVLLGLQFVWLLKLERMSAMAHRAALHNYLAAVGTEVEYFYRKSAERALNVPAPLFTQGHLGEAAASWAKKPTDGARRLFLVDYTRERFGNFLVYDPARHALVSPPASEEALAIIVACMPWQLLSYHGGTTETVALRVDERNPDHRIILNPITDDASRVVGVAGMILDVGYFERDLLPAVIRKALPGFFPDVPRDDLEVTVRDAKGSVVLGAPDGEGRSDAVTARFPFVFGDWTLALLAVALVGGIVLALRAADRAMRLSEMKSDFVSNVSHELRTPLSSIRVFAELLRLGRVESPAKVQEYGEYIEAESRRLSRLIENILDFSRIESGRKVYRFILADLGEVVAGTIAGFEVHLRSAGFRIVWEGFEAPLPRVSIDPEAIGQALHNLLDNAVKYSGEAKEITVRLARDGDHAVIAVKDRGIGIPRDEQARIFDRFHRVATGLVHEVKGSGLGLAIVRHIVDVHGDRIAVESDPGKGSTFTIRLPLPATAPAAAAAAGR